MSFNFPNSPVPGQVFQTSGPAYTWDGTVWKMTGTVGVLTADPYNRIINGAMQISQEQGRGGSPTSGTFPADQWYYGCGGPTTNLGLSFSGNPNGVQLWNGAGTFTPIASSLNWVQQKIEGLRVADFGWGTAAALPAVLRFRAWTNIATPFVFGVAIKQGPNYCFVQNFTATSTPTDFVMTIPGPTVGTWPTDNSDCITVGFSAMSGSNFFASSPRTWVAGHYYCVAGVSNLFAAQSQGLNIANVGLYLDPLNTGLPPPFVTPDFASELIACRRYFHAYGGETTYEFFGMSQVTSATASTFLLPINPTMRTAPAVTSAGTFAAYTAAAGIQPVTSLGASWMSPQLVQLNVATAGNLVAGNASCIFANNNTATRIFLSARM